jgi:uncharacterized spore protein YtfJ
MEVVMQIDQLLSSAKDAITVKRVFGEPYEKNGITFIPAASVAGGGGGGSGSDDGGGAGEGGGFGVGGRPAGAYIIKGDDVRWQPAVDVTRLAGTAAVVIVAWLFTRVRLAKVKAGHKRSKG